MRKALVLMGLAAAVACGSSAGDMMENAFDGMTDVPDAGAQTGECPCEAGPQGGPGPQGEPGEPGPPVVFCAEFGAFCGFSGATFDSMTACRDAVGQLGDNALTCTVRNLEAAKSGDNGGCAAIANLDPCGFTPAPMPPENKAIVEVVTNVPDAVPTADATHPYPWFCQFDSTNTISLADGQQMLFKLDGTLRRTTGSPSNAGVAYRAVGDVTDGTILGSPELRQALGFEFLVGQTFVSGPLVSDDYQVGVCVKNQQWCPTSRDDGCPEYEAIIYNSKVTTMVLDLQ